MKNLAHKWKSGSGPIGSGVFYADGSYRAAIFEKESCFLFFGEVTQLPEETDFTGYGEYENGRLRCEQGMLSWGGGPWEGEGWIALMDQSEDLIWIMHFENSEPFTQARYFSGLIEVVAYEYPVTTVFSISANQPHLATCSRE